MHGSTPKTTLRSPLKVGAHLHTKLAYSNASLEHSINGPVETRADGHKTLNYSSDESCLPAQLLQCVMPLTPLPCCVILQVESGWSKLLQRRTSQLLTMMEKGTVCSSVSRKAFSITAATTACSNSGTWLLKNSMALTELIMKLVSFQMKKVHKRMTNSLLKLPNESGGQR